jgi:hypothetical protein
VNNAKIAGNLQPRARDLAHEPWHVLYDPHLTFGDPGRAQQPAHIPRDAPIPLRIPEGFAENPVRVADSARSNPSAPQRGVPALHI